MGGQVEGVADAQEALDGDGRGHEDGGVHGDVGEGVDDGQGKGESLVPGLEGLEGVVDSTEGDVEDVKDGQGQEELVEAVP